MQKEIKRGDVQISCDPKRDIAYLRLRDSAGAELERHQLSDEVNIEIGADGAVYGIELLNANAQLRSADGGHFVLELPAQRLELPLPATA
jgi:uncharacterized protein YuzE